MFKKRTEDPFYEKLKDINKREPFAAIIKKAFYLGGFVFSSQGAELVEEAILQNRLKIFLEDISYNIREDNIELYLIEDELNQVKVIVIRDPVELYNQEKVLKIIPGSYSLVDEVASKQIYP